MGNANATLLRAMKASPAAFRANFLVDVNGELRRQAEVLDPWQRADFEATDPGWMRAIGRKATGGYSRSFQVRPRGHSKTSDSGQSCLWSTLASPTKRKGVWLAGSAEQAGQVTDVWISSLQANPVLRAELKVLENKLVNTRTGSETVVMAHQYENSYGLLVDWLVADEISWWPKPDLWYSLASAIGKKRHAMLLAILNSGIQGGWVWNLRQTIREDSTWHFSELPGPVASWISPEILAEQQRILPDFMFDRLWLNKWLALGGLRIKDHWLRIWRPNFSGLSYELLGADGMLSSTVAVNDCTRAMFVDPAGTSADVADEKRGRTPSWSVILAVDYTPSGEIVLVDVLRVRCEIPDLIDHVQERYESLHPQWVGCENSGIGLAAYQLLGTRKMSVRALEPGGRDKATRFAKAQVLLQQGKVFLPESAPWLADFRTELLSWTGHPKDVFDQGDCLGYAGLEARDPDEGDNIMYPLVDGKFPHFGNGGFTPRRRDSLFFGIIDK